MVSNLKIFPIFTIILLIITAFLFLFALKEKIDQGQSEDTFVPHWMTIIGGLVILEQQIFWLTYWLNGKAAQKYVMCFGTLLRCGIVTYTSYGVVNMLNHILTTGGFSEAPLLFMYGFSMGLVIITIYLLILIITICCPYCKCNGEYREV